MPALPPQTPPTIEAIYNTYQPTPPREHLGASQIGTPCDRSLWYSFRWATTPQFSQRMLRLFQTGVREENRIIENLRDAGITVYDRDPNDPNKQISFKMYGGHYAGSVDGVAIGFPEAPKTWHVVEVKTSNAKAFKNVEANGLEKANPVHHCQVQQYMHWSQLERAYYFCVCKENDSIYGERVYYNPSIAEALEKKASDIIFVAEPPFRSDYFGCRWCTHKSLCQEGGLAEVNCRTCAHSTPCEDGTWTCKGRVLNKYLQREGCDRHIFIPALVPLEVTDASEPEGTVSYGDLVNGPGHVLSRDLKEYIK